jgi:hypothetical protein
LPSLSVPLDNRCKRIVEQIKHGKCFEPTTPQGH